MRNYGRKESMTKGTRFGQTGLAVLKWVQSHPFRCQRTTVSEIVNHMANDLSLGEGALQQALYRLIQSSAILKDKVYANGYLANFKINYNILTLPKEILDKAPSHITEVVERTNDKLKSGEYVGIDPFGAGIIKEATKDAPPPRYGARDFCARAYAECPAYRGAR